jgi:hypothetical protein
MEKDEELALLLDRAIELARQAEKEAEELARSGAKIDAAVVKRAMVLSRRWTELAAQLRPQS